MMRASIDERVARVLPDLYALTSIESFPAHVLPLVTSVVGGDKGDYTEVHTVSGDFRVVVDPEPPELRRLEAERVAFMAQHPVMAHFWHWLEPEARLISDFLSPREYHRLGLYGDFFSVLGVEDQLTIAISSPAVPLLVGLSVDRNQRSFNDDDRAVLARLRPHLEVALDNSLRLSAAQTRPADKRDRALLNQLTGRQLAVLREVCSGLTNSQIASGLDISVGTVRKHLEHILRTLGVTTRTAAAAMYLQSTAPTAPGKWTAAIPGLVARPNPAGQA